MHTSPLNFSGCRCSLRNLSLVLPALAIACCIGQVAAHQADANALIIDSVVLQPMVEAEVPARHTGVLARIHVAEGAAVAKDAVLATLDPSVAKLAVQKAETEREQAIAKAGNTVSIEYAEKALEVARAELRRSTESVEKFAKSVSQSQIDVERLTVEKLELEQRQAEHEQAILRFEQRLKENALETARLELDLHVARAPFAGVVSLVRGRPGEWVQPGTVILRLIAVDALRAEGFAPATALSSLKVGAKVQFRLESESNAPPAEATLQYISPEVDPVTRQVRVWCRIDNADLRLRPGQQGQLRTEPAPERRTESPPPIAQQADSP
jgi:multidrug efflux pump subunit AcrA (membrane-fusion protein)